MITKGCIFSKNVLKNSTEATFLYLELKNHHARALLNQIYLLFQVRYPDLFYFKYHKYFN